MKTITKSDISSKISSKLGFSIAACEGLVNKILGSIVEFTLRGDSVHIKNFGNFSFVSKKARPGRDIKKGATILIEERNVMRFSATRNLKQRINEN